MQIQAVQKIEGVESLIIESSWVEPLNPVGSFILNSQSINLCDLSSLKWHSQSPLVSLWASKKSFGSNFTHLVQFFEFWGTLTFPKAK